MLAAAVWRLNPDWSNVSVNAGAICAIVASVHLPTCVCVSVCCCTVIDARFYRHLLSLRLGLSLVRHSLVGDASLRGISGGEKRRLSYAVEMVTAAPIVIADLPTNGLDSSSAFNLLHTVKEVR